MTNPLAARMATTIAEKFPTILIEKEANVLTLEDADGERYIVTVQTVFENTNSTTQPLPSLPDLD